MACFNCEKSEDVAHYSFDLDLPSAEACPICRFALSMGDDDLLRDMRPRKFKAQKGKDSAPAA